MNVWISVFLIYLIVLSWLILSGSLKNAYHELAYGGAENKTLSVVLRVDEHGQYQTDPNFPVVMDSAERSEFSEPRFYSSPSLPDLFQMPDRTFLNLTFVSCTINGETHTGQLHTYTDQNGLEHAERFPFQISCVHTGHIFDQNQLDAFQYRNPHKKHLIGGTEQLGERDMLISDEMLRHFIPDCEIGSMVGDTVSFSVNGTPFLENYRIAGIMDDDICTETTRILIPGSQDTLRAWQISSVQAYMPVRTFTDLPKALDYLKEHKQKVNIFLYETANLFFQSESVRLIVNRIISMFGCLILAAVFVKLIHVFSDDASRRRHHCGLQKAMGMTNGSVLRIALTEISVISVLAAIPASVISYLLVGMINGYLYAALHTEITFSRMQFAADTVCGILCVTAAVFLIHMLCLIPKCRMQPAELLRTGRK